MAAPSSLTSRLVGSRSLEIHQTRQLGAEGFGEVGHGLEVEEPPLVHVGEDLPRAKARLAVVLEPLLKLRAGLIVEIETVGHRGLGRYSAVGTERNARSLGRPTGTDQPSNFPGGGQNRGLRLRAQACYIDSTVI